MKAVVLEAPGKVALREVPKPEVRAGDLLIRMEASTICTSDLQDIRAEPPDFPLPIVLGHEGAGRIVEVGVGVESFQIGDRVSAHPVHSCGKCASCEGGLAHLCDDMGHFGINLPGTFAEYFTVRADRARKVPPALDPAVAALGEPVAVCLEAVARARVPSGGNLLILGDGPFGLMMSRLAAHEPLEKIAVVGRHEFRLNLADSRAARLPWDAASTLRDLEALAEGRGWDAAILAVASPEALDLGLQCLRPRGRLVVFAPFVERVPLNLRRLLMKELEIAGACNDDNLFDRAVASLSEPVLAWGEMVTHRFALERFSEALEQAASRPKETLKVALINRNP